MKIISAVLSPNPVPSLVGSAPQPFRWTVAAFHQAGEAGVFAGRRAMLIDGVIVAEGPMNPPHAIASEKTEDVIRAVFGTGWRVRVQKPLVLGRTADPEPDVAVIRGGLPGTPTHPTAADLVIEISDTSLVYDITKVELYATAGVPEYWAVDLDGRRLLVSRDPQPLPAGLGVTAYRTRLTLGPADSISPLAAPHATIQVADLLP